MGSGSVPDIWQSWSGRDFSKEALLFAQNHIRQSTNKHRRRAWNEFSTFCRTSNVNPLAATPGLVASWLAHITNSRDLKGDTAKRYFGHVLSSLRIAGSDIEQHPDAKRLRLVVQGITQKPSRSLPEDDDVHWATSSLTAHWATRPTALLELPELRSKALCLLMIAGIARPSDLARLDLTTLRTTPKGGISLRVWRAKNSGEKFSDPMVLPRLQQSQAEVCPTRTLRAYIEATARVRPARAPDTFHPVFLSQTSPYDALSPERISVEIKKILRQLGIPVGTYSVRRKTTTEALEKGFSIQTVAKAGRWRSLDVLQNHYNRTRNTDELTTFLLTGRR